MHWLDLPMLRIKPSSEELSDALDVMAVELHNFDDIPKLDVGTTRWLTDLASQDLEWLPLESADELRDRAADRLAMQCGTTARAPLVRKFDVGDFEIQLHEPGWVNDFLGFKTWGASFVLANRLSRDPDLLRDSATIAELGAGTGLAGIMAAKLGASVTLTDLPEIVPNLAKNVALNGLDSKCEVLDWSQPEQSPLAGQTFDLLLISDPVYSIEHPEALLAAIDMLGAQKIIMELPLRRKYGDVRNEVYLGLEKRGYDRKEYTVEDGRDDFGPSEYAFSLWLKAL